jgi:protein SCO1/2
MWWEFARGAEGILAPMNIKLVAVVVAALALGALVATQVLSPSGGPVKSNSVGKAAVGGPFILTDQDGRRRSDTDFRGKLMLVYFGYTFCPDVCPAGLQVMAAALDKLGAKAESVAPIFISLDPERDTPAKLKEYLSSFHAGLIGLTGSKDEIAQVAKAYRVYFKKVVDERHPADYSVDHTSIIYLMGRDGSFVSHATHASNADALAAAVAKAL